MLETISDWLWLQSSQWRSKEQLARLQLKKLRRTVERTYKIVPFYHNLCDTAGVSLHAMQTVADFARFPIATNDQYRSASLRERTAKGTDVSSCMTLTTSGSTGAPVTVLLDPYAAAYRDALNLRMLRAYGVGPLDKVCRVRGGFGEKAELAAKWVVKRGMWSKYRNNRYRLLFFTGNIREHLDSLLIWKPTVLIAAGSYCKTLIEECEIAGMPLAFKVVVTTAELSDEKTRTLIRDKFHAEVFDHYANEEVGSIAWECPSHAGYHLNTDSSLVEVLKDGKSMAQDEAGEVHVTSFYQMATPIVRYATGDVAELSAEDCPCGRGLGLMKNLEGRVLDFILTPDGHNISPIAVVAAMETTPGMSQYKLTQNRDLSIDVFVRTNQNETEMTIQELNDRCRILFGNLVVRVNLVDEIEFHGSKLRLVESRARNG